jgi:phosphoribosyl 1,2-cyclic phosphodiesterase
LAVRVSILASSSSGNCAFLATDRTRVLIDAGLSKRETFARLAAIGEDPRALDAILITHEHSDHVAGLPALAKALKIPVYLTRLAAPRIDWNGASPDVREFQAGASFVIGDLDVGSFTIPHDAVDPVAFCLSSGGRMVGIATDLGYIPDSIKWHLRATDFLLLESNHDLDMLKVGPYPWSVKQRVMGRMGHLSNDVAARFIQEDLSDRTRTLVLGHLSEHNNYPDLVRLIAGQALERRGLAPTLIVADPKQPTPVFSLG